MKKEDVILSLGNDWARLKELLDSSLCSDVPLLNDINASLLLNGGKMLRPMLTLFFAKLCGGSPLPEESIQAAASVELLHNATLLHDDVADNAATRRGNPTVLSQYGAVPAVLVGDFWLARAVGLLVHSSHLYWMVDICSRTLIDLAEGEMLQQQKAFSSDTTSEDYLRIIYGKTASLFETACKMGAVSVSADEAIVAAAGTYGNALGMAFQIRDDILDYTGGEEIGKPVGIDLLEQKITLPLLGALENSGDDGSIRKMIHSIPEHPEYCAEIRKFVIDNGGVEYAENMVGRYVSDAVSALGAFAPSKDREILEYLALSSANREK